MVTALIAPALIAIAGAGAALITDLLEREPEARDASFNLTLTGRVTDAANVLSTLQVDELTARMAKLEHDTGHQLVVVTVRSLHGEDIAAFTRRHANTWGIGRAGYNDGVVLLVAPNDRMVRIEVGRGLERLLTNARCAAIINQRMIPRFTVGDLPGGIAEGAAALDEALR